MTQELEKGFYEHGSYDEHDFEDDLIMYDVTNFGVLHLNINLVNPQY